MGCDIHVYFEHKKEDGQWEALWPDEAYPVLEPEEFLARPEVGWRQYAWFAKLAGIRDPHSERLWDRRGWPADSTENSKKALESWDMDAFGISWQMVSELINHPDLQDFVQVEWLKKFIPDPENTRMLYFFDN